MSADQLQVNEQRILPDPVCRPRFLLKPCARLYGDKLVSRLSWLTFPCVPSVRDLRPSILALCTISHAKFLVVSSAPAAATMSKHPANPTTEKFADVEERSVDSDRYTEGHGDLQIIPTGSTDSNLKLAKDGRTVLIPQPSDVSVQPRAPRIETLLTILFCCCRIRTTLLTGALRRNI